MASKTGNLKHFSISGLLAFSDDPEPFKYDFEDSNSTEDFENEFKKRLKPITQRVCHICQILNYCQNSSNSPFFVKFSFK